MKNGRGTLFPYLGDLGPKWKMDINFQVPDPMQNDDRIVKILK